MFKTPSGPTGRRGRTRKLYLADGAPSGVITVEDASFGSPSGAGAAVAGRADNGRTTWRVEGSAQSCAAWRGAPIGDGTIA
jgi:hypothetical protein